MSEQQLAARVFLLPSVKTTWARRPLRFFDSMVLNS